MGSRQRLATGNGSTIPLNWYTIDVTWSRAYGRLMQLHEYTAHRCTYTANSVECWRKVVWSAVAQKISHAVTGLSLCSTYPEAQVDNSGGNMPADLQKPCIGLRSHNPDQHLRPSKFPGVFQPTTRPLVRRHISWHIWDNIRFVRNYIINISSCVTTLTC